MAETGNWPKYINNIQYSEDSSLNTLDVCLPRPPSVEDSNRFWVVYIHGGAWRDPEIDSTSFQTMQQQLLDSTVADRIAGYASINYRLSPYPSHSTNPSEPADPARNAKHPDHVNDVLNALLYLQDKYGFGDHYILVGHSCGATLALQVAMRRYWGTQHESTHALELNVEPPAAIVGIEGIYDIRALVRYHKDQPIYEHFVYNAYGSTEWDLVSPVNADFNESWPDGKLVVIAHSHDDSLVEWEQVELQKRALETQGWNRDPSRVERVLELKGDHDEVWQTGEAAKAVMYAIETLTRSV